MQVTFSPRVQTGVDSIERWLLLGAQYVLCVTLLVAPFLFFPPIQIALGFTKSFVLTVGVLVSLIVFSLFLLRAGMIRIVGWIVLAPLWMMVAAATVSAVLSGDRFDAFIGDTFSVHTVSFLALLALVTTTAAVVLDSKKVVTRFFIGFCGLAILVETWHVLRFIMGSDFLGFGMFTAPTASLLGSFNDVALFAGLVLMLAMVALLQLPMRGVALGVVGTLVGLSLVILSVVNFFLVWVVVGFFSLLSLLYALTRDRLLSSSATTTGAVPRPVVVVTGIVCGLSALFLVAGTYISGYISDVAGIQFVEVRPTLTTTMDIASAVYKNEGALFGIGPNRFEEAWRLYKNPAINETVFWNTAFLAGSGYLPTIFITTGVFGGAVMVLFLIAVLYVGYRTLVLSSGADPFWYFVGTIALAGAVYVWGMSVVYVPGTALFIIGASLTGVLLVAHSQLASGGVLTVSFSNSRPRVFVLIALVMVVIASSVGALFMLSKQYVAHVIAAQAFAAGEGTGQLDQALERASLLSNSDTYVVERVSLRLATLNALLANQSPTAADQQRFQDTAVEVLKLSEEMLRRDGTSAMNHALLGSAYGILAIAGVENASEMARTSLKKAQTFDPLSPEYSLIEAQLAARTGNVENARAALNDALSKKSNYIDALFLLSQVEASTGNTEAAVAASRSVVGLEPQNPARHFQLGAILFTTKDFDGAYIALSNAIALDPNFANARYLLALTYLQKGDREAALSELRAVQSTNTDNAELATLIEQVEQGGESIPALGLTPPVSEPTVGIDPSGITTTGGGAETDLLAPVNRTSGSGQGGSGSSETIPPPEVSTTDEGE